MARDAAVRHQYGHFYEAADECLHFSQERDFVLFQDKANTKLAQEVGADIFIIVTDAEGAALYYGEQQQILLRSMTLKEAGKYQTKGQFLSGAKEPRTEAAVNFVAHCRGA